MLKKLVSNWICLLVVLMGLTSAVNARPLIIPAAPQLAAEGYLLLDADSGKVLVEHNADVALEPASLTKMMTSYIVSSEVHDGNLSEDDQVRISVNAWKMGGSKMFVREGTQVAVKDLLRGVIIQSGNDASVALAEHIAGSEDAFVDVMNQQAALLGMNNTYFKNATGWPIEGHLTTARDLSILARALIRDFPEHYKLYSEKYFAYNNINQPNRNKLLFRDSSVDGIKTGHTEAAGYCLVSSASKDNMRLIAVVMGARSESARAAESQKLLTYGFRYFKTHKLYSAGDILQQARVWAGSLEDVDLGVNQDIYLTIPRGSHDDLEAQMHIDELIKAPLKKGQELGNLTVNLNDDQLLNVPLVAQKAIAEAGFFARIWDTIRLFFFQLLN